MRLGSLAILAVLPLALRAPCVAQLPAAPSEAQLRDILSRVHAQTTAHSSGATREAVAELIEELAGEEDRLWNHAGVLMVLRGHPWEALRCLIEAALPELDDPDALNNIAFTLLLLEQDDDAERILLYATTTWPQFPPPWVNLARVYVDAGDYPAAEECLRHIRELAPGASEGEELAGRMAIRRGDGAAAAEAFVALSALDAGSPLLPDIRAATTGAQVETAARGRAAALPMPRHFVELPPFEGEYVPLVLEELGSAAWGLRFEHYTQMATQMPRQNAQLTPEIWDQLPDNIKAILAGQGLGPGESLEVLSPSASRMDYPQLNLRMNRDCTRFRAALRRLYDESALARLLTEELDRQRQFSREYAEAVRAGADPLGAMNRYCHQCITSLEGHHGEFLTELGAAREEANRLTAWYWLRQATMIAMAPEEHRAAEANYLQRIAAMSNQRHTGSIGKWLAMGRRPVALDRELAGITAEALHTAAAAREFEAWCERQGWNDDFDWGMEDDREPLDPNVSLWVGLNLGVFAVKVTPDSVSIEGGEGIVAEASFDWGDMEVTLGIGGGASLPTVGPLGGSGKMLGVVRLGGREGAALGIRSNLQATAGSPVSGVDYNLVDQYTWLVSAGR
jgi:hypothetical protein